VVVNNSIRVFWSDLDLEDALGCIDRDMRTLVKSLGPDRYVLERLSSIYAALYIAKLQTLKGPGVWGRSAP
jgi:hypothetical protein